MYVKQCKFAKDGEKGVRRAALRTRKIHGPQMQNIQDLINSNWRIVQWFNSLGEIRMTGFHTRHCRCEGVGRDSSCGHEEPHLMHDTKYFIYCCINYMEYG